MDSMSMFTKIASPTLHSLDIVALAFNESQQVLQDVYYVCN